MRALYQLLDYKKLNKRRMELMGRHRPAGPPGRHIASRFVSILAATLLFGWQMGTPAVMALTPTSNTNDTLIVDHQTQLISAKALTDHECNADEWHFVITQIDVQSDAPATIHVTWANGHTANVALSKFTGHTAHYVTTFYLDSTVTSATAHIYSDWSGQFNLSHGPCVEQQGSVKVNKAIDFHGNGSYTGGNTLANEIGFKWGLDEQTPANAMGATVNDISVGQHTVTENSIAGYRFTGWYYTGHGDNSCTNPVSTRWPRINVQNDQTTEITLCNQAIIHHENKGSITIIKDAQPDSTQTFNFSIATLTANHNFTLEDNGNNPSTYPKQKTFDHLAAGVYVVSEAATHGWLLHDINCNEGADVQISDSSVSIDLGDNQDVTCVFVNKMIQPVHGRIMVYKQTVPAGDKTKFTITASGTGTIEGNANRFIKDGQHKTYSVTAGTYNISEQAMAGWAEDTSQCQNLVISALHPTATCTIINSKAATLTIIKDAQPNSDQAFHFDTTGQVLSDFALVDNGTNLHNSKTFTNLLPGNYAVEELAVANWDLRNLSCTGTENWHIYHPRTVSLSLAAGDSVTCTFVNKHQVEHLRGSIHGAKFNDLNNDGRWEVNEPHLAGWTINLYSFKQHHEDVNTLNDSLSILDGSSQKLLKTTTTDESGNYYFSGLKEGWYKICEVQMPGWIQTDPSSNNGCYLLFLRHGQNVYHKDFGNFRQGTVSGFKFNDVNGNHRFDSGESKLSGWNIRLYKSSDGSWAMSKSMLTNASGNYSFGNLAPGSYLVCEVSQSGWTRTYPANSSCTQFTINTSGQNVTALFGNMRIVRPVVLGATTGGLGGGVVASAVTTGPQLVNTGNSALRTILLGVALLGVLAIATRAAYPGKQK